MTEPTPTERLAQGYAETQPPAQTGADPDAQLAAVAELSPAARLALGYQTAAAAATTSKENR